MRKLPYRDDCVRQHLEGEGQSLENATPGQVRQHAKKCIERLKEQIKSYENSITEFRAELAAWEKLAQ